jgi:xanthine dehydrogenase iron-sulfur cluster and FAD-binding subunit A
MLIAGLAQAEVVKAGLDNLCLSTSHSVILSAAKNLAASSEQDSSLRSLETPLTRRCFTAFSMTRASFYAGADAAWGIDNSE